MYSEKVMDHFQNPRNVGEIENASGVGTVGNAKCGDIMRIYLDIDDNGVIQDCKFKTFGCGAAVATSSMATELSLPVFRKAAPCARGASRRICQLPLRTPPAAKNRVYLCIISKVGQVNT